MITKNQTIVGKLVAFNRVKTYNPMAGKVVKTYGFVTEYIRHDWFGVVFSYEDGEYGECVVRARDLELVDNMDARESVMRWRESAREDNVPHPWLRDEWCVAYSPSGECFAAFSRFQWETRPTEKTEGLLPFGECFDWTNEGAAWGDRKSAEDIAEFENEGLMYGKFWENEN